MHRLPSRTEVSQTITTVSSFRGPRRRMPPPGSVSGLIVAPPAGREGRGECVVAAMPRNTKAFSGRSDSSLGYFKAPDGPWQGQLRTISLSYAGSGAPDSPAPQLRVPRCFSERLSETCSLRRYSHSAGYKEGLLVHEEPGFVTMCGKYFDVRPVRTCEQG